MELKLSGHFNQSKTKLEFIKKGYQKYTKINKQKH